MSMNRRTAVRLIILALAVLPLTGCSYNKFVSQEEAIKAQWAQVQNQLQRRNDLIPNLVETVKGYAAHEEGVYKDIADARSRLLAARSPVGNDADIGLPGAGRGGSEPGIRLFSHLRDRQHRLEHSNQHGYSRRHHRPRRRRPVAFAR